MCVPSRNGAFDAIKSAAVPRSKSPWGALRLFPCLCVLRPDGGASASPEEVPLGCAAVERFALPQPPDFQIRKTPVILCVPTISPHLVQYARVRRKQCLQPRSVLHEGSVCFWRSLKKLKLTARHRTSLNRVNCTNANTYNVRTSGIIPPYKKPESKGRLWSPLVALSPLSVNTERGPPEVVSKKECR